MSMLRPVCCEMNCVNYLHNHPDAYPEELEQPERISDHNARGLYRRLRRSLKTSNSEAFVEVLDEIVSKKLDHLVFGTLFEHLDEFGLVLEITSNGLSFFDTVAIALKNYANRNPLWGYLSEEMSKRVLVSRLSRKKVEWLPAQKPVKYYADDFFCNFLGGKSYSPSLIKYISEYDFNEELHTGHLMDLDFLDKIYRPTMKEDRSLVMLHIEHLLSSIISI
ncbi:hypothetical protein IKF63_01860 [Candidatus Saccharibacteria bacterium]|nr:hypothetical protein [Candidatus Saccharibacteria bacterium]